MELIPREKTLPIMVVSRKHIVLMVTQPTIPHFKNAFLFSFFKIYIYQYLGYLIISTYLFFVSERYTTRHGQEKTLPGLEHNVKQLFWLSAANTWCSKYRPKSLEKRIKTGAHSPGMFRVKGPFSNSKEFARDFNCPVGSTYNPVNKCEVW